MASPASIKAAGDFCIGVIGMRDRCNMYGVPSMIRNYARKGMTAGREKALREECRAGNHTELVQAAAQYAAPGVAKWIVESIMEGKSFDRMAVKWELGEAEIMPCCRNSFYSYRKLTLAILDRMIQGKETA